MMAGIRSVYTNDWNGVAAAAAGSNRSMHTIDRNIQPIEITPPPMQVQQTNSMLPLPLQALDTLPQRISGMTQAEVCGFWKM
jgi:hypothetical protein